MKTVSFLTVLTIYLLSAGAAVANSTKAQDAIHSVFVAYATAEDHGDYVVVYRLLSRGLKQRLHDEQRVNNAEDYRRLRESSEARWNDLHESSSRATGAGSATIKFRATIEENGECEKVLGTLRLVLEKQRWKIDVIDYGAMK